MSHPAQLEFVASVRAKFPALFARTKVLEVGSLNINGSIRSFFTECAYLGVDIGPGLGVDLVARGEDLEFPDDSFDVVASCECFEHNPEWVRTFNNMVRMSRELVFFTCATTGRAEHGTPRTSPGDAPFCGDYYQNLTEEDFRQHCDLSKFKHYEFSTNEQSHDLYFFGVKHG
jgi:SAM-dependent methyltransferase